MSNHLYRLVLQVPYASAEAFAEAIEIHCDTVAWTECRSETTAKVTGFSLKLPKEETVVRAVLTDPNFNPFSAIKHPWVEP